MIAPWKYKTLTTWNWIQNFSLDSIFSTKGASSSLSCRDFTCDTQCPSIWKIGRSSWNIADTERTTCRSCKTSTCSWRGKLVFSCDLLLVICRLVISFPGSLFESFTARSTFGTRAIRSTLPNLTAVTSFWATCRCSPIHLSLSSRKKSGWLR